MKMKKNKNMMQAEELFDANVSFSGEDMPETQTDVALDEPMVDDNRPMILRTA